jgi:S1-C subfamily serine protease
MCGLGACGCMALGTQTLTAAWRDAGPTESEPPDVVLQPPKPESELARAGAQDGDLLLAVDGEQVRALAEIQAAIRKHAPGDEVRLLVQRASESPRELNVRHVSDYPRT